MIAPSKTAEYSSWSAMIQRCENPKCGGYKHYGGRGIAVCKEWRLSFLSFFRHMGTRPEGTSIDRIDNNGNYEPGNCRWATKRQQVGNKRPAIHGAQKSSQHHPHRHITSIRKPAASKRSERIDLKLTPGERETLLARAAKDAVTITDYIVCKCCR